MFFLNKTKQKNNQQNSRQSVCYWNSSSPPAAWAAQLNMIDIQTIFIKMWMDFFKNYMVTIFKASFWFYLLSASFS